MAKYLTLIPILLLLSCEELFNEDDNKYELIDNQEEYQELLNGAYYHLAQVHNYNYFMMLCRSDDVNLYRFQQGFSNECQYHASIIQPDNIVEKAYWHLYLAIINSNKLMVTNADEELVGEAYFLRAYCYFKLARLFGTPPLVKGIDVSYFLEKPSYLEVYQFIESDLLLAIDLLPANYKNTRVFMQTPHTGTAKAMLAEVYLAMAGYPVMDTEKYKNAAMLAGEVIQKSEEYGFYLVNDFAELWSERNTHHNENIFGLFFSENLSYKNTISRSNIDVNYHSSDFPSLHVNSDYSPEFGYYLSFPDNYRKYTSMITGNYLNKIYVAFNTDQGSGKEFIKANPLTDPCIYINSVQSLKHIDPKSYLSTNNQNSYSTGDDYFFGYGSKVTLPLLRYATVLLTYAEASAQSNNPDALAYEAINKIRRRANHLNLEEPSEFDLTQNLTKEQFIDSVVWERAWELFQEPDGRWFDIIRLNLKDKLIDFRLFEDVYSTVPEEFLTDDWYFYKIPQKDRWLNPNFADTTDNK